MRDFALSIPFSLDSDLRQAGWNGAVNPYPGITTPQFAYQHLRRSILKKFQDGISPEADSKALALFLSINEQCRNFELDTTTSCFTHEAELVGEVRDLLYDFFHQTRLPGHPLAFSWGEIYSKLSLGNGANIGSPGTDFISKVGLSELCTTNPALFYFYEEATRYDTLWADVESIRLGNRGRRVVKGSRLAFVPKTRSISRTICTEPLLNMFFQKGIGLSLERLLRKSWNIDLRYQPDKNRRLAQLGSSTGRFATIDLSSASDSMSNRLCELMLPEDVLSILRSARSASTTLPGGAEVELHMISSMGNAYTFPLQTIFFTAVVLTVYKMLGLKAELPHRGPFTVDGTLGNFAVFGDDIIVLTEAYHSVCHALSLFGFKVNQDKSFHEGDFRESCGHDYIRGYNVRGVYLRSLRTLQDQYSAINRLNRWSCRWGIPLPSTIHACSQGMRRLYVPMHVEDTAGVKVPFCARKRHDGVDKKTGATKYRYLRLYVDSVDVSDSDSPAIGKLRGWKRFPNPPAILLAAIAGKLRDAKVSIRALDRIHTRFQLGTSSSWDLLPSEHLGDLEVFGDGWKTVIEANLQFLCKD